uniref:Uncharacterized protein n=1 Tax=Romanomermis culicivorax TaxID=13658 RepID=A0A915K3S9_ROMCU
MPYNWPYHIQATANWGAQVNPFAGSVAQFAPLLQLLQAKNAKQKQPLKIEDSASVSGIVEEEDDNLENGKEKR